MPRKTRPFLTLDCETDPFKKGRIPVPFIWGLYDGQTGDYLEFAEPHQVVEYLSSRDVLVYAHNGGKFDYHYLREWINSDEPINVINGRIGRFHIGRAEFRDSFNILVNPLRAFAKDDIDYAKLEPDVRHLHMPEIRRYLRSDCVNLWDTCKAYFDKYGSTLTQAGAAFKYWKKNYKVEFRPQTMVQSVLYRDYYYGGRVQCFQNGYLETDFAVVDINSAYPYAMLQKHPLSPEGIVSRKMPREKDIPYCFFRLKAVAKSCFPLRTENGSLYFPDDERTEREYFVTGWELKAALDNNAVRIAQILEVHSFSQMVSFGDYVNHFYEERKTAKRMGDKMGDTFAKLFLNSLYGKFAADPEKYAEYVIASDESLMDWCENKEEEWQPIQAWGARHLLSRRLPEEKHRYYNVATAASITGFVRAYLFDALSKVSQPIYCDTDSIAARSVEGLSLGGELGQWKHEADCCSYAVAGKKLYAFRNADPETWGTEKEFKTASKGARLNPQEIIRVAKGERITFEPEVPTYSIHKPAPFFVPRDIKSTYKDVSMVPT